MNIHSYSRRIVCPFKSQIVILVTALLMSVSPAAAAPPDAPVMSVQFFEAVPGGLDVDVAAAIVASDALIHTPEGDFVGSEGAGQFAATLQESFSNVSFATQEPSVVGDFATVRWTMTGIHSGSYHGLQATGADVSVDGIAILRFDDLAIVEQWIAYDRLSVMIQIQSYESCGVDCLRPGGNR